MTRIDIHTTDDAPNESREGLEALHAKFGRVDGDDQLTALLALAREIAGSKGHVEDGTWKTALEAGWSEQQVLEAFADTVRTVFTNYFNHLVDIEQDVPDAPAL